MFVGSLDEPVLDDGDAHHLVRVRRTRVGDSLTISDGQGAWRPAVLGAGASLEITGEVVVVAAPTPSITIGVPATKGDRTEWMTQKLTELGVDRIVILACDRSVVRWDGARARRNLERLARIAREAATQSRQVRLLTVDGPARPSELDGVCTSHADLGGAARPTLDRPTVLIGPEGGWSDHERAARGDRSPIGLGPHVLRVETAALAAAVSLTQLRHDGIRRYGECC